MNQLLQLFQRDFLFLHERGNHTQIGVIEILADEVLHGLFLEVILRYYCIVLVGVTIRPAGAIFAW